MLIQIANKENCSYSYQATFEFKALTNSEKKKKLIREMLFVPDDFVCFDSLCPIQQFSSRVGTGLPGLNQYLSRE